MRVLTHNYRIAGRSSSSITELQSTCTPPFKAIRSQPHGDFWTKVDYVKGADSRFEEAGAGDDAPVIAGKTWRGIARDAMKRAAEAIRGKKYASAYDLFGYLASKMCELKAH